MTEPNLTLGESSKVALPVRWAVLLGAALLALGGGVAVAQVRLSSAEVRLEKVEEASTAHAVHDASVDADIRNIRQSLDNIDRKLDRMMERRGVRTADGEH